MPVSHEQFDIWRTAPSETQTLEFKEAKNQYDTDKLFGYCVAIANEGGEHLILGIKNKPPRDVVGTSAFPTPIAIAERIFQAVGFRVDLDEVKHPAGRVLVLSIPSRLKGTAYHLEGKYLMRSGESLVPMSEDQLRRIFAEGKPDWLEVHSKTGITIDEVR
jgi:ATP-dependent DNA helicase RecG